jgi:hypothetical protein
MSELSDELDSKRETLLSRRGHLIRILTLILILLSLVIPVVSRAEYAADISVAFFALLIFAALALGSTLLLSTILCLGALMSEYAFEEYRDVFYKGDIIKGDKKGCKYRKAIQEADELMNIYDEAENRLLTAIGLWAFTTLWTIVFILLGELSIRGLQWVESEWAEIVIALFVVGFIIILPAVIIAMHLVYLWNEFTETDAWDCFVENMGEGHDHLSQWRIYRWLAYPLFAVPRFISRILSR